MMDFSLDHHLPTRLTWRESGIAWALAALFFAFSAFFVLGEYQTHSGDMGQYVTHARNVLWGRPWGHFLHDFPAVLPGYPLLILPITAFFGMDVYLYALLNSMLWAALAVTFFALYRDRFSTVVAFIFLIALLFNPFTLSFQQEAQPNIFYAASVAFAFLATHRLRTTFSWPLAALVLLPALIRQDSLALYMALLLYFLLLRNRLALLPLLGIALTLGLDALITLSGQFSNLSVLLFINMKTAGDAPATGTRFLSAFAYMLTSYLHGLTELVLPKTVLPAWLPMNFTFGKDLVVRTSAPRLLLTAIMAAGFLRGKLFAPDKLFFGGHLVMISLFLLVEGTHYRYLLPIFPIYLFYTLQGLLLLRLPVALCASALLIPAAVGACQSYGLPEKTNTLFSPPMNHLVAWLQTHDEGKGTAYYKNRLLIARLDSPAPSASLPVERLRESWQVEKYLSVPGYLLIARKGDNLQKIDLLTLLNNHPAVDKVYEDAMHAVFRVKPLAVEGSNR